MGVTAGDEKLRPDGLFAMLEGFLRHRKRRELTGKGLKPSAVLVPLFDREGVAYLLLTKRTSHVAQHKKQISFPGGVRDPHDADLLETALRESNEEVGLDPRDIRVIGQLDDAYTVSTDYVITPFVAIVKYPFSVRLNPREVEKTVEVPLDFFMSDENCRAEETVWRGQRCPVYFYQYDGELIWGATARIIRHLVEIIREAIRSPADPASKDGKDR